MKTVLKNILAFCATVALTAPAFAQLPPENERGFKPDSVYQLNGVDTVNLFNGNLNLAIHLASYPVSSDVSYSFELDYSGNLWETHERCQDTGGCTVRVFPQNDNAGLGWRMGEEQLFPPTPNAEEGSIGTLWRYQSRDGSDHALFDTLHEPKCSATVTSNCDPVTTGVRYTRDGTYIRMKDSGTAKVLEYPNGVRQRYILTADGGYRLQYVYGTSSSLNANGEPTTNWVKYEYQASTTYPDVMDWHVTDSLGRSHYVYFQPGPGVLPDVVDKLVLSAFRLDTDASNAAATATYNVTYDAYTLDANQNPVDGAPSQLRRPCFTQEQSMWAPARLLSRIDLPSGETWQFTYNQPTECDDSVGTLTEAILPTRGRLRWTYQNYQFSDVDLSTGVYERRMVEPNGTVVSYTRYALSTPPAATATTVENYAKFAGDWRLDSKVVNYFNRSRGPFLGLPFNSNATDGTTTARNLSTETYDCNPQSNTCSALPDTRTYVKYELDYTEVNASAGCDLTDPCAKERNRRLKSDRTLYLLDASRTADVDRSNFDGLGNYRYIVTSGNFTSGNSRQTYTGFNHNTLGFNASTWTGASVGSYSLNPNGTRAFGFTMLNATDSWILGTFTDSYIGEGGAYAYTQACFNPATGFLHRKRSALRSDGQPGPNDFLQVLTRDSATGYASRIETFGGDHQTLCNSEVCEQALCTMTLPTHNTYTSRVDHTFQYGKLKTSRAVNGATGANMPSYLAEFELDANTGLTRSLKDESGLATTFSYDRTRRLTKVTGPNGIVTDFTYTPASDSALATVGAVAQSGTLRTESQWIFDRFGRMTIEKQLQPDNKWAASQVTYDAAGRQESVSEREEMIGSTFNPARKTVYSNYDAFGRVGTITAPDSKITTLSYVGARTATRTYNVATPTGTQSVAVTEERDRAGRLISVTENATGSAVTTDYTYDVGNHLASVKVRNATQPERTFVYDGRGVLASETHPESGTTSYTYDSRGLMITKTTPVATLTTEYDPAGRVTRVKEGANELKFFTYDRANNTAATGDYSLGKLATALRHNRDTSLGADITVLETFYYTNPEGRTSGKRTAVSTGETFDQSYSYDPLGHLSTLTYPSCTGCALLTEPSRTVSFTYDADRVEEVGVPGDTNRYADNIKYHPNGMVREIRHRNADGGLGPLYEQTLKDGMARPELIKVSSFCDGFTFSTSPQNRTVIAGQPAGLTAAASGATSYEWYKRVGTTDTLVLTQTTAAPLPTTVNTTTMFWVRAKNGTCSIDSDVVTVTVSGDAPPVADFTYSCSGRTCSFNASSSDDDIDIISYQWNFGDAATGSGVTTNHTYSGTALSFVVTLTVTDTIGQTNQKQRTVALDATPTTLGYFGGGDAEVDVSFLIPVKLTRTSDGVGIGGRTISVTLGSQTATYTTNFGGFAYPSITPTTAGNFTLSISFAGDSEYAPTQHSEPIYVSPVATVTGTVRNAVTQSGVSGVTVSISSGNSTTTNASGVYSLSTPSGEYTLTASKTGYSTVNQTVNVLAGDVLSANVNLPVSTNLVYTGPTTGSVQTPLPVTARLTEGLGGTALSGRLISFQLGSQSTSATTDSNGVASASLTPSSGGTVNLQTTFVSAAGYGGKQIITPITIASTGTVQGVIRSAVTTSPINSATVSLTSGGTTLTNASGQYSLSSPAGSFTLNVTKVGYVTNSVPVSVTAGQTVTTDVNLVALTSLTYTGATTGEINVPLTATARLMDTPSNTPIAGRLVGFTLNGAQFTTGTTDANGYATVTLTPLVGGTQPLVATFSPFGGWAGSTVTTQIPVAASTVSGTIRNAVTLAPIDAASITLSTGGTATTNASGQYSLTTRSGTITVTAAKSNYATGSTNVTVALGGSATANIDLLVLPAIANNSPASGELEVPLTLSATVTNSVTGAPIAGRQVTFTLGAQSATGTTNASGVATASITPSISGTIALTISTPAASGYAAAQTSGSVVIAPRAVVSGTVRDAVTSQPVSGVTMTLTTGETTTTNASGQYSLSFHSGFNTLTATKAGYVTGSVSGNSTPGQVFTVDFTLLVMPAITYTGPTSGEIDVPLTLTATLLNGATSAPLGGRVVTFTLGTQTTTATTNASGVATATITPAVSGTIALSVSTPAVTGYAAAQSNTTIVIAPLAVVSGTVRSAVTSQPISGVTMALTSGETTTTDASGHYSLSFHSGFNTITATKTGYVTGSVSGTSTPGQVLSLDFSLQTTTAITYTGPASGEIDVPLTLTARLNENVGGGVVAGRSVTFTLGSQSATGTTDASGVASVTITPATSGATNLTIDFAASGGYAASQTTSSISIATAATLSGIVRSAVTLNPIAGATVTIVGNGATTTTDASGVYTFSVRSGTYTVNASKANYFTTYSGATTLTPGQSGGQNIDLPVTMTLAYTGPVSGELNVPFTATALLTDNVTGLPVAGLTVTFVLDAQIVNATTNASGVASATLTPHGTDMVQMQLDSGGGNGYAATGRILAYLEIADQPTLIGYVRNVATNAVISGATVTLSNGATTTTAANGQFAFGMRSGSYAVTVANTGYVTTTANVTLAPGDVQTINMALRPTTTITYTGALEGAPLDSLVFSARLTEDIGNTPVVGATLTFVFDGEATQTQTDSNGEASLTAVAAADGVYTLTVTHAGSALYGAQEITKAIHIGQPSTIYVTSKSNLSLGSPESVSAVLQDANGTALAGRTVTFTIGTTSVSATTDATGKATATMTHPGPSAQTQLTASFAGDSSYWPRSASMPVLLYEMTQFSIWGGEDLVKPAVGDTRPFAGWDWMNQVTSGDFQSDTFDGYFYEGMQPLELCQADRSSISSPALDNLCLRAPVPDPPPPPPGDIDIINLNVYPEMTSTYIAVAVPTSIIKQPAIVKQGGIIVAPAEIYGNISAIAVVEITAFDTATGGSGIIRDIVADGVQLFTALRYTGPSTMTRETPVTVTARLVTTQDRVALANKTITFTLGTVTVTATTKLDGTATATMTLPATESTGSRTMTISFAGAGTEPAASITTPIAVQ